MNHILSGLQKQADILKREIWDKQYDMDKILESIENARKRCTHTWGQTQEAHIHTAGGHSPGDGPEVCGPDKRLAMDWEPTTKERWKRVCTNCGEEQFTKKRKTALSVPDFG